MTRRTLLATAALAQAQTNKEIRIGILGAGARGIDCLRITLTQPNIRVAAVCDINEASATRAQQLERGHWSTEGASQAVARATDAVIGITATVHPWNKGLG